MVVLLSLAGCQQNKSAPYSSWELYRGDEGSNAYSSLDQINTKNISRLKVAWTYRTGDASTNSTLECNPIIVDDILYGISPRLKAFALNAKTGAVIWVFDPFPKDSKEAGISRGLTYWRSGQEQRVFLFAANKLIALDATTGKQIMDFGEQGYVDLNRDLREKGTVALHEDVKNSSPGIIYKDLIISGSLVGENYESSPGHIRAYDVRTGKMKWIFHTIPRTGEPGYDTWPKDSTSAGSCNAWSGLSLDRKRGIVFAATGSPSFDFYGGERIGQNLFGNSVIAIDAATGKYIWHYQTSHHDLWDYDLPAPPNLVTVKRGNQTIDAVAQISKQGFIFLFDRETGSPLFPIEEKPVAVSKMPGEQSWPTQPFPSRPLPLSRQKFDESMVTDISPQAHDFVLKEVEKYSWGAIYLPPDLNGIIQMPGFRGGAEWSGACVDVETGIMYAGTNDIPNIVELQDRDDADPDQFRNLTMPEAGNLLYISNCSACHAADLKGNGQFPALLQIEQRLKPKEVKNLMEKGRAMMPSFSGLSDEEKNAIISYLFKINGNKKYTDSTAGRAAAARHGSRRRYKIKGYTQLLDQDGFPGIKPPWGTLNAVDLNSGNILWKVPLGQYPVLTERGIPATGTQLFGGGIVTAGGLIFIGASKDEKFRAIDKLTGKTVWEYQLPAGGYATPATYQVGGKQYVVIAAGGGGNQHTQSADYYIAFTLQ